MRVFFFCSFLKNRRQQIIEPRDATCTSWYTRRRPRAKAASSVRKVPVRNLVLYLLEGESKASYTPKLSAMQGRLVAQARWPKISSYYFPLSSTFTMLSLIGNSRNYVLWTCNDSIWFFFSFFHLSLSFEFANESLSRANNRARTKRGGGTKRRDSHPPFQ